MEHPEHLTGRSLPIGGGIPKKKLLVTAEYGATSVRHGGIMRGEYIIDKRINTESHQSDTEHMGGKRSLCHDVSGPGIKHTSFIHAESAPHAMVRIQIAHNQGGEAALSHSDRVETRIENKRV